MPTIESSSENLERVIADAERRGYERAIDDVSRWLDTNYGIYNETVFALVRHLRQRTGERGKGSP